MNQPDQKSKDADLVIVLTWCLCGAVIVITAIVGGLIIYCVVFRKRTIQNNEKEPGQPSGAVEGKANDSDTDSAKLGGYFKPPKIPAVIKAEISEENEFLAECGGKKLSPKEWNKQAYFDARKIEREKKDQFTFDKEGLYVRPSDHEQFEVDKVFEKVHTFVEGKDKNFTFSMLNAGADPITHLQGIGILTRGYAKDLHRYYDFHCRYEPFFFHLFKSYEEFKGEVTTIKAKYSNFLKANGSVRGNFPPKNLVKMIHKRSIMCRLAAFSIQMGPVLDYFEPKLTSPVVFTAPLSILFLIAMRPAIEEIDRFNLYMLMKSRAHEILKSSDPGDCFKYCFPLPALAYSYFVKSDSHFREEIPFDKINRKLPTIAHKLSKHPDLKKIWINEVETSDENARRMLELSKANNNQKPENAANAVEEVDSGKNKPKKK